MQVATHPRPAPALQQCRLAAPGRHACACCTCPGQLASWLRPCMPSVLCQPQQPACTAQCSVNVALGCVLFVLYHSALLGAAPLNVTAGRQCKEAQAGLWLCIHQVEASMQRSSDRPLLAALSTASVHAAPHVGGHPHRHAALVRPDPQRPVAVQRLQAGSSRGGRGAGGQQGSGSTAHAWIAVAQQAQQGGSRVPCTLAAASRPAGSSGSSGGGGSSSSVHLVSAWRCGCEKAARLTYSLPSPPPTCAPPGAEPSRQAALQWLRQGSLGEGALKACTACTQRLQACTAPHAAPCTCRAGRRAGRRAGAESAASVRCSRRARCCRRQRRRRCAAPPAAAAQSRRNSRRPRRGAAAAAALRRRRRCWRAGTRAAPPPTPAPRRRPAAAAGSSGRTGSGGAEAEWRTGDTFDS